MLRLSGRTRQSPLYAGDVLTLPSYKTYVAQPGDGYLAIAQKLGVDVNRLLRINCRTLETPLLVGAVLELPR